jgi:hypothetical protein
MNNEPRRTTTVGFAVLVGLTVGVVVGCDEATVLILV